MASEGGVVLQFPIRNKSNIVRINALRRLKNLKYRSREYLTEQEVAQLISAARRAGRHGHRDATLILLAYRHGLRVSELVNLQWDQIDLQLGLIHINRLKNGDPSVHPLAEAEVQALLSLQSAYPKLRHVFSSERNAPLSSDAFRKILARAGRDAQLPFTIHPHMLRHACGYKLAKDGQDTRAIQHYLGHKNIQHTVRYTQLSPDRFKNFWNETQAQA